MASFKLYRILEQDVRAVDCFKHSESILSTRTTITILGFQMFILNVKSFDSASIDILNLLHSTSNIALDLGLQQDIVPVIDPLRVQKAHHYKSHIRNNYSHRIHFIGF